MSKNPEISAFFNQKSQKTLPHWRSIAGRQHQNFENLHHTINTILDGKGHCAMNVVGQHRVKGFDLPVVNYAFSNAASLVLRDNGMDYVASVRSPLPVPGKIVTQTAYSPDRDMDRASCAGLPSRAIHKSYAKNQRIFTFHSWMHENFKYFVVEFAKLQKTSMTPPHGREVQPPDQPALEPVRVERSRSVATVQAPALSHSGS